MTFTAGKPEPIERFRAWLRSDMRILRWVLLGLYLLLIFGLLGTALFAGDGEAFLYLLVCVCVFFAAQALFIFGAGTIKLCRPIRKRRLLLPVIAASFMLTILLAGFVVAMAELFLMQGDWVFAFVAMLLLSWILWGFMLFSYAKNLPRYQVLTRLSRMLFAGSLAELLATVPAHLIVIRRPGCLVGLATMLGIIAGLSVMFFAFGPMIVVLFLRPRYRAEKAMGNQFCENCGYDLRASIGRCPECGQLFTSQISKASLDPRQG